MHQADASASATQSPASTNSSAPAVAADMPKECDAYLTKVEACVNKLGTSNPAAGQFKTAMDASRAQWATISDKTAMAQMCKQANDAFAQSASAMGC